MTRRLRKGSGETAAEALWRDAWGSGPPSLLRKRSDEMPAEALWRDVLRKRCDAKSSMEGIWREAFGSARGATPAEALWRRRLRKRSGETPGWGTL